MAAGSKEVFELARCPAVSNHHDLTGETPFTGICNPVRETCQPGSAAACLEMDDPEHRFYRSVLNPYLSPAAVKRWEPFVDEIVRACLDEKIETGSIDFVDDLANVVPAVLTLGDAGHPAEEMVAVQRTDARLGVHAGGLARHRPRGGDAPGDGPGPGDAHGRDPREPAARAW